MGFSAYIRNDNIITCPCIVVFWSIMDDITNRDVISPPSAMHSQRTQTHLWVEQVDNNSGQQCLSKTINVLEITHRSICYFSCWTHEDYTRYRPSEPKPNPVYVFRMNLTQTWTCWATNICQYWTCAYVKDVNYEPEPFLNWKYMFVVLAYEPNWYRYYSCPIIVQFWVTLKTHFISKYFFMERSHDRKSICFHYLLDHRKRQGSNCASYRRGTASSAVREFFPQKKKTNSERVKSIRALD